MLTKMLSPKDPAAEVTIVFDFADQLGPVAQIASADAVTVTTDRGDDATPGATLKGASTNAGTKVYQPVQAGTAHCDYRYKARITTNESPTRKLVVAAILPVRPA